jgi:endonuclease/exonuclease/phosphatase family metal-dependent hydrolase
MLLRRLRWGLAGVLVAWTLVRAFGLERGWPLVPLMALTPQMAVLGLAGALVAAWRRWWIGAAAAGVCAAVLLALLVPRALPDRAPAGADGVRVRILAANVAGRYTAGPAMLAALRLWRVDVFSVAELTPSVADAFEQAGIRRTFPRTFIRPDPSFHGTGLYSRLPFRGVGVPGPPRTVFEPAAGELRAPGAAVVQVIAVHVEAPTRPAATERWRRELRALPPAGPDDPLRVIAGDFNSTLDHAEFRRLLATGYHDAAERAGTALRPTWPAGTLLPPPLITIDHVLADKRIHVISAHTVKLPRSDHRGVLADLLLPDADRGGG